MFRTKVVEKIKTHIFFLCNFFFKSRRLWDYVEKYCTAGQATSYACWIPKATNTHPQYVTLLFQCNNGFTNAPLYYIVLALSAFFNFGITWKWVVTYAPFPLNLNERTPGIQLIGGRMYLIADLDADGKWKLCLCRKPNLYSLVVHPWCSVKIFCHPFH